MVFAYLDKDRDYVDGTIFEMGYAKGLGKTVILVDERSSSGDERQKHLNEIRHGSDVCLDSFQFGITLLKAFDLPCSETEK